MPCLITHVEALHFCRYMPAGLQKWYGVVLCGRAYQRGGVLQTIKGEPLEELCAHNYLKRKSKSFLQERNGLI